MTWLKNLNIGRRLALAFGAVLAILVAVAVVMYMQLAAIKEQLWTIVDINGKTSKYYGEIYELVLRDSGALRSTMLSGDAEGRRKAAERMEKYRAKVDELIPKLDALYAQIVGTVADATPEELAALDDFKKGYAALVPMFRKAQELALAGNGQEAFKVWEHNEQLYRDFQGKAEWLIDLQAKLNDEASEHAHRQIATATMVLAACTLLAVLLAATFGWLVTRSIVRPLSKAVDVAGAIAAGDLSRSMQVDSTDETGRLLAAMKQMQEVLNRVVDELKTVVGAAAKGDFSKRVDTASMRGFQLEMGREINTLAEVSERGLTDISRVLGALAGGDLTQQITNHYEGMFARLKEDTNRTIAELNGIVDSIKESTDTIKVASGEIASGNSDLSQRTEEQASSLEETAASMEELTSTVKQNSENARQANQLVISTSEIAGRGGQAVNEVVVTMDEIAQSSKKIEDIITVIDGIAFQTNILALNAAVEAARAGEEGKGFAVVAGEVRNLAQRSAAAAKEIKTLIQDSVEKIGTGSRLVADAGKTMEEVVASVKRVTDIMGEITAASMEQTSGIEQVSTAVTQMDQVTQQNAALVEEAAATAESLQEQAQSLAKAVSRFRVAGTEAPAVAKKQLRAA